MKKVALMQPYLFPYLGYFQLIKSADLFIVNDDVQWIKGGWINRNRILFNGDPGYITLPVQKDSYKKLINERVLAEPFTKNKQTILKAIKAQYKSAPHFSQAINVIEHSLEYDEPSVSLFTTNALRIIADYLGINTEFMFASNIPGRALDARAQDRVIDTIKQVEADMYINAIGGTELYDKDSFTRQGIELKFIKMNDITYKQSNDLFSPNLSIIDVMMFNSRDEIRKMLDEYQLI